MSTFSWKNSGGSSTAALQATVTTGGAIAQGDFLLVMLDQGGGVVTAPAGWTLVGAANNGNNAVIFWKIAGASEPSSYTFSWTSSGQFDWAIASWSGISGTPIDKSAQSTGSNSGPYVAPSVTPVGAADLLLCLWDIESTGTHTPPVGMTTRLSTIGAGSTYLGISELPLTSNGATATESTSGPGTSASFWATAIALTTSGTQVINPPFVPTMRQYLRAGALPPPPPSAPVVTNGNFSLTVPASSGQAVGTMTASGLPTSWAITAGNTAGDFVIDNSGNIIVTAAGASGLVAGSYSLTCSATNSAGSGSGTAAITATAQSSGSLPSGVTLHAIDGETMLTSTTMSNNYYARNGFTNAVAMGWDNPGYLPVGTFNSRLNTSIVSNIFTAWADLGFNTAFCRFNTGDWDTAAMLSHNISAIENGGASALSGSFGANFVGFLTQDEPASYADGATTPISGTPNASQDTRFWWVNNTWAFPAQFFSTFLTGSGAPATEQLALSNLITTPSGKKRHIDLASADVYFFAGTRDWGFMNGTGGAASRLYNVSNATPDQSARGSSYGDLVDIQRGIQTTYNAPILTYIETGDPFNGDTGNGAKYITADEIYWSIWQTLIHGGRLVDFFDISFSGPGGGDDCLSANPGGWYTTIHPGQTMSAYTAVKSALALAKQLAPVLGSPSAAGYCTVTPSAYVYPMPFIQFSNGVDINVKWSNGQFYILSSTRASETVSNISATFTINSNAPASLATVVGENRTIPIVNHTFTDTFAKASTVHIYQIS